MLVAGFQRDSRAMAARLTFPDPTAHSQDLAPNQPTREASVLASVCATMRAIGLDAVQNTRHGWITLTDHKRPYRVPVLPAELRA